MERSSYKLPISVGCSYNACRFCMLFKHLVFRELPMEQIEDELKRVKNAGGAPKQVFLGDGNAFAASTERLISILGLIHRYFPSVERINMDATVTNIAEKSDSQLKALHDLGVDRLYLGIESGLDDVLSFMNKDHTLEEAYRQIDRLHEAGMTYAAHMMTGVAGEGRGLENAEAIADFFNRTGPKAIINFSMFVHRRSALYREVEAGRFKAASELENLKEDRRIIELLKTDGLDFDGFHDMIEFRVRGRLPQDREKMLASLDAAIEKYSRTEPVFSFVR